jgi:hypothetical protein
MAVLDIDMDYFLDKISRAETNLVRLSSKEYKTWEQFEFIDFIENKIRLNKGNLIKGKVVTHHNEAFYCFRDAIDKNIISYPFKLIHVDAHADFGYIPDGSQSYIVKKYLDKPYDKQIYPEFIKDFGLYQRFDCSNFLLYSVACGWIVEMDYLYHPTLEELDMHGFNISQQKPDEFTLTIDNEKSICRELFIKTIPKQEVNIREKIDLVIISRSPQYTTKETDELVDIIRQYIVECW